MDEIFSLRKFIFIILRRWRMIVIVTLIFTCLGGLYKIVPGFLDLKDEVKLNELKKEYQNNLLAYEQQKSSLEREILYLNEDIENSKDYNKKSLLMKINPYDEFVSSLSFYVDTDYQIMPEMMYQNPDKTDQILNLYLMMARDGSMYEEIREKFFPGLETRYVQEIVTVIKEESDSITISAKGDSYNMTSQVVDFIYEYIINKQNIISESAGQHTIKILRKSEHTEVDFSLRDLQKGNNDRVTTLGTTLTEKNLQLTNLEEPKNEVISRKSVIMSGMKFAILGCISGIGISILLIYIIYLIHIRVYNEEDLENYFSLKFLGNVKLEREGE